jgi:hypothetical protein
MNALRYTTVAVTCLALALPLNAFSPCCCVYRKITPNCSCSTPKTGSCCCNLSIKKTDEPSCSDDTIDRCERSCHCSVRSSTNAVRLSDSKHQVDIAMASWPIVSLTTTPILAISLRSSPDGPPISHNRRQATLCVWLN